MEAMTSCDLDALVRDAAIILDGEGVRAAADVLRTLAQESCASSAFELAELYLESDVLGEG